MTHHKVYQTEGIILGKKDFGEADRMFSIYTKEFGMINAIAQGVRFLKSKLRYNLDTFSICRAGLIKGRDFWRIVDAEEILPAPNISDNEKFSLIIKISKLIKRMVRGEEKNDLLWKTIRDFFVFLKEKNFKNDDMEKTEISTVLDILYSLGYVDKHSHLSKKDAIITINRALKESHL
ncbi:MAG: DNA repair protein RecO [Patescibacteria group bacterium]